MFRDRFAVAKFEELIKKHGIRTVVETGTYQGRATAEFCLRVDQVVSIEIRQEFYRTVEPLQKTFKNLRLVFGNSALAIPGLRSSAYPDLPERWCFFLDAHWYEDWPLLQELRGIAHLVRSGKILTPLIIIHDFKVIEHPDFGFDRYKGQDLDWDYVKGAVAEIDRLYAPSTNTEAEGSKRGILYLEPPPISSVGRSRA